MPYSGRMALRCAIGLMFLAACVPATGDTTTITKPGTGPANTLPLEVLSVGSLINGGEVDALISTPKGNAFRIVSHADEDVTWALVKDGNLYVSYLTLDGALEHPLLFVPAQVRDGMEWDASLDGSKPSYHFTVARTDGTPVQWTITELELATGLHQTRTYFEGSAPMGTERLMPPQDTPVTARRAVELEALQLPPTVFADELGVGPMAMMSAHQVTAAGPLQLFAGISVATAVPQWTTQCASVQDTTVTAQPSGQLCKVADGMAAAADGHLEAAPRSQEGKFVAPAPFGFLPDDAGVLLPFAKLESDLVGQAQLGSTPLSDSLFTTWQATTNPPWTRFIQTEDDATHLPVFVFQTPSGLWWTTALDGDVVRSPAEQGQVAGRVEVQFGPQGHTLWRTTADGSVDRLHVVNGDLQLEHVADVPVAKAERLEGAFLLGDRLLVAKRTGLAWNAQTSDVRGPLSLWRTTTAISPGPLTPVLAATGITTDSNTTIATAPSTSICFPPRLGTPSTDWTFGGVTPLSSVVSGPRDNCRLFFLPKLPSPMPNLGEVRGTLPGFGAVFLTGELGTWAMRWEFLETSQLAGGLGMVGGLSGGGFTDGYFLFARGGLLIGRMPKGLPKPRNNEIGGSAIPDAAGGLWTLRRTYSDAGVQTGFELRLFSDRLGNGSTTLFPVSDAVDLRFVSEGGGAVVWRNTNSMGGEFTLVARDGTQTSLGSSPLLARFADGTLCSGGNGANLDCHAPGGPTRTLVPNDSWWGWVPEGGGHLLLRDSGRTVQRFDVNTMTVTPVLPAMPHLAWLSAANGPDGAVWLSLMETSGVYRAGRIKAGVFTQLDLGASSIIRGGGGDPSPPVADDQTVTLGTVRFPLPD